MQENLNKRLCWHFIDALIGWNPQHLPQSRVIFILQKFHLINWVEHDKKKMFIFIDNFTTFSGIISGLKEPLNGSPSRKMTPKRRVQKCFGRWLCQRIPEKILRRYFYSRNNHIKIMFLPHNINALLRWTHLKGKKSLFGLAKRPKFHARDPGEKKCWDMSSYVLKLWGFGRKLKFHVGWKINKRKIYDLWLLNSSNDAPNILSRFHR